MGAVPEVAAAAGALADDSAMTGATTAAPQKIMPAMTEPSLRAVVCLVMFPRPLIVSSAEVSSAIVNVLRASFGGLSAVESLWIVA